VGSSRVAVGKWGLVLVYFLLGNHDEAMNEQGYWLADSLFLYCVSLNEYTKGSLTK
jgi:hypothetical protein